jgi:type II secretion system protein N
MKSFVRWLSCFLYIVAVAVACFYVLFPADAARRYITAQVGHLHPDVAVTIDRVRPIFPPGLGLQGVALAYKAHPIIAADEIRILPQFISLIRELKKFSFHIDAHSGMITGRAEITGLQPGSRIEVNANASAIRLEGIPLLEDLLQHDVEGNLGGRFFCSLGPATGAIMQAEIGIQDLTVLMVVPGFNMDRLAFERVRANIRSDNGQIDVSELTLNGQRLEGELTGGGRLADIFWESTIELKGTLRPKLDPTQASMQPSSSARGAEVNFQSVTLPVTVYGPLNNLRFSMK